MRARVGVLRARRRRPRPPRGAPVALAHDARDPAVELEARAGAVTFSAAISHIIPGPYFGYLNSSIRLVTALDASRARRNRFGFSASHTARDDREVLHALRAPVGGELRDGHAPHLLGVGLEEVVGRAATRSATRRSPRGCPGSSAGGRAPTAYDSDAAHRLDRAEVAQHVHRNERVVVELAAVEDAALARPVEHGLGREDLVPELVDRRAPS